MRTIISKAVQSPEEIGIKLSHYFCKPDHHRVLEKNIYRIESLKPWKRVSVFIWQLFMRATPAKVVLAC